MIFADQYNYRKTGRPRFARKNASLIYFGMGIGLNPYDHIQNIDLMQLPKNIISDMKKLPGISSDMNFIGMPTINLGFISNRATFLRNNLELFFQSGTISNKVTDVDTGTVNKKTFSSIDIKVYTIRVLYELLFQTTGVNNSYSFFIGGGFGVASQINIMSGKEVKKATPDTTNPGDSKEQTSTTDIAIASNKTSFAPVFSGVGGFTINISTNIAFEGKVRYFAMMTPLGSDSGTFEIYRHGVEVFTSILVKF